MKYQPETITALKNELARAVELVYAHVSYPRNNDYPVNETTLKELGIAAVAANAAYTIAAQIHASESQEHEFGIAPDAETTDEQIAYPG